MAGNTSKIDGPGVVRREMISSQVREIILERILRGDYAAGERLVETRIARELGVSQGSVREALRALEGLGYVESAPHRGTRVRPAMTREAALALRPVRAVLEQLAAETAVRVLAQHPGALRSSLAEMRKAARAGDVKTYAHRSTEFHRLIVNASGNQALVTAWESLGVDTRMLATTITSVADLKIAAERHAPIYEAIVAGDVKKTATLLREHQEYYLATAIS
jgi:DNA-binding GntR family transcriptional regulator